VYAVFTLILAVGLAGVVRLKNESHIVDDLPTNDPVMRDLGFFEEHFSGVMPLEVVVDTRKRGQALKDANLRRIERLQDTLATYPELSRSLSIADAIKFTKQSFYGGDPDRYALLRGNEKSFILPYVDGARGRSDLARAFLDTARQSTRISVQMADVGTTRMDALFERLRPQVDSIFHPDDFDVKLTGTSVVFLKGSEYMVTNLLISLGIAVVLISGIMALVFNSFRMVIVSLIPNLVPLITTAGIMGYMGIAIKPSTILVFSIAFGISVDDAIHYLAKYRQELKLTGHNIRASVFQAIREAGVSMIYTSIVLFCGFILFLASDFGGTQALGVLVSITLLVAMFTNVLILPSLLLSFEKTMTTRSFEEPIVEIMDEDEAGQEDGATNGNGASMAGRPTEPESKQSP
jgi:predicted RND superfamily exporter protein